MDNFPSQDAGSENAISGKADVRSDSTSTGQSVVPAALDQEKTAGRAMAEANGKSQDDLRSQESGLTEVSPKSATAKESEEESYGERAKEENHLTELSISVFLLSMLGLLIANIVIFEIAVIHNDNICARAAKTAASAVVNGMDGKSVQMAVQREMSTAGGGFFIVSPQLTGFSDEKSGDIRVIKVRTQSYAKIPVQRFVWSDDLGALLTLRRIYVVKITSQGENKKTQDVTVPNGN